MKLNSPHQWKTSASITAAIIAVAGTVLAIAGVSLTSIWPNDAWWELLMVALATYVVVLIAVYVGLAWVSARGTKIRINGISVTIKQGDLFEAKGWKVISFNEYFDTTVDDVLVTASSVNGVFLQQYVDDPSALRRAIDDDAASLKLKARTDGRIIFPLGRCIPFNKDYILLAFTRFSEQNIAHLSIVEYLTCMLKMWEEIRRLYADRPVFLPLLGSGIMTLDGVPEKSNSDLLRILLESLKLSGVQINQPITILLTKKAIQEINLYEMKSGI